MTQKNAVFTKSRYFLELSLWIGGMQRGSGRAWMLNRAAVSSSETSGPQPPFTKTSHERYSCWHPQTAASRTSSTALYGNLATQSNAFNVSVRVLEGYAEVAWRYAVYSNTLDNRVKHTVVSDVTGKKRIPTGSKLPVVGFVTSHSSCGTM
jgi:hypothetical protein